jgi:hypothetical protein
VGGARLIEELDALLVEIADAYRRETDIKRAIIDDIGVQVQVDTLTIYLIALLVEVRLLDVTAQLAVIENILNV